VDDTLRGREAPSALDDLAGDACNPNQAFVVQFRTRPCGAPSWEGRVEHLVSYQVARFHSLDELLASMLRVLTEVEAQDLSRQGGDSMDEQAHGYQ
jgi:hypothetical protein